ncbi:MAG: hypothetical protein ACXW11_10015 [Methylotenera sp.]
MAKRGRILRDTNAGIGLISADGSQYEFKLEENWDSDIPPTTGMVVEIEFDVNGKLVAAWAVDEKDLAKEQANLIFNETKQRALDGYNNIASLVGKPVLAAVAALILGWFILNIVSLNIDLGFGPKQTINITFWQILGIVNNIGNIQSLLGGGLTGGSKGFYGFLCVAAVAGPFIFIFWKHPLAHLGNCLALALIIIVVGAAYMSYTDQMNASQEALSKIGSGYGQDMMKGMADKAWEQAMKMINIGLGAYLSLIASAYLAFVGITKYLVAAASSRVSPSTGVDGSGRSSTRRKSQQVASTGNQAERYRSVGQPIAEVQSQPQGCPSCHTASDISSAFCGECGHKFS